MLSGRAPSPSEDMQQQGRGDPLEGEAVVRFAPLPRQLLYNVDYHGHKRLYNNELIECFYVKTSSCEKNEYKKHLNDDTRRIDLVSLLWFSRNYEVRVWSTRLRGPPPLTRGLNEGTEKKDF